MNSKITKLDIVSGHQGLDYPEKAYENLVFHLSSIGKDREAAANGGMRQLAKLWLHAMVSRNPKWPDMADIGELIEGYISAMHYGSLVRKNYTLEAHLHALSDWLTSRAEHSIGFKAKIADTRGYDIHAPLDPSITPAKARELLGILDRIYGRDKDGFINLPVDKIPNWDVYANKLAQRATEDIYHTQTTLD